MLRPFKLSLLLLVASATTGAGQTDCDDSVGSVLCDSYAGYHSKTDVVPHSLVARDAKEIATLTSAAATEGGVTNANWAAAKDIYENGLNSFKSDGAKRTIKGFSANSDKLKANGKSKYQVPYTVWFDTDVNYEIADGGLSISDREFGNTIMADLFDDNSDTVTAGPLPDVARKELINKQMVYLVINQYVMYEFLDAVKDCASDDLDDNDGAVHAWDEGVAFWVGSDQEFATDEKVTVEADIKDGTSGYIGYAVTQKRAGNFLTYQTGKIASANDKLNTLFQYVQIKLINGQCKTSEEKLALSKDLDDIWSQMTVFAIQGTLRYAFKTKNLDTSGDNPSGDATKIAKEKAEGTAFMRALAPLINVFDKTTAKALEARMEYDTFVATDYADTLALITKSLYGLGLKCEDIKFLADETALTDGEVCTDLDKTIDDSQIPIMADYVPGSNVLDHSRIDLDVAYMNSYLKDYDFDNAMHMYTNGRFSKDGGRNVKGFSNGAVKKLKQVEVLFDQYSTYWGSDTYADDFVMAAYEKTEEFVGADDVTRKEAIMKGSVYLNIWMYVLREFYDAVEDCEAGTIDANDDGVHAWDEGVAFFVGQLQGADGDGPGNLLWKLGEKRCANYGTCTGANAASEPIAKSNANLLADFIAGRDFLQNGQCAQAKLLMPTIEKEMSIPLIQGALRYAHKNAIVGANTKSRAEGWAFTAAILPRIDACDPDKATIIKNQMIVGSTETASEVTVFDAFRSTFECLEITCEDIGTLDDEPSACSLTRSLRGN